MYYKILAFLLLPLFMFATEGVTLDITVLDETKTPLFGVIVYTDNYSASGYTDENGKIYKSKKKIVEMAYESDFNPSASISFGIDIKVKSSRIRLEPNFQLALRPLVNNVPFGTYFYKGGLNVAYIYNF